MLSLYCYNSPMMSSAGFQEAQWVVNGNDFVMPEHAQFPPDIRSALTDGGAEALCMDTDRKTRVFILRNIHVNSGSNSGWHLNFALETDCESSETWADTVAAFLRDYDGCIKSFANLFSVIYDTRERYVISESEFAAFLRAATGSAAALTGTAEKGTSSPSKRAFQSFADMLSAPYNADRVKLLLLVPSTSINYFLTHTSIPGCSAPQLCIGREQWTALLAHREPVDVSETPPDGMRGGDHDKNGRAMPVLLILGAAVGAGVILYGVYGIYQDRKYRRNETRGHYRKG